MAIQASAYRKTHFNKTFKRNMAEPSCKMKTYDEEKIVFDAFEKI